MPGGPVTSVCQQQPVQRRGSMCPRLRAECRLQDRGSALRGPSPGPATRSALVDVAAWCTDLVERLRRSDDDDGLHAVRVRQLRGRCVPRDGGGHPSRWDLRPAAVLARDALGLQVRQQGRDTSRGAERDPQGGRRTRSGEHQAQGGEAPTCRCRRSRCRRTRRSWSRFGTARGRAGRRTTRRLSGTM